MSVSIRLSNEYILPLLEMITMTLLFLIGMPGGPELILIAFVVLLLFGGKKLPELMKGLGKGIREFNNAKANIETEVKESMRDLDKPKAQPENKSTWIEKNEG